MLYQRAPYSISQGAALQYHVSYDASPFFPLRVLASPFLFLPWLLMACCRIGCTMRILLQRTGTIHTITNPTANPNEMVLTL